MIVTITTDQEGFTPVQIQFNENGKSAYQIWLDLGNTGTEADFINSLKGLQGDEASIVSKQYNQNNITFKSNIGDYFGKVTAPRTGTLTFDTTDAVTCGIAIVYYQNATLQMPNVWRTIGTFAPNELNKIYLERDSEGYITCNIVSIPTEIVTIPFGVTDLTLTEETFSIVVPAPNGVTDLTLTEEII